MATASSLFGVAAGDAAALSKLAASTLAVAPGQACLLSLAGRDGAGLRPVAIAHERSPETRRLRRALAYDPHTPPDAFSREVFQTGDALRMVILSQRQLELWWPVTYMRYVDRTAVSSVLAAAMRHRDRVVGTLLLRRERDRPPFDELDLAYVKSLAARLSLGLAWHPEGTSKHAAPRR